MESKAILEKLVSFNTVNDAENEKIMNYIENYLHHFGFTTDYKTKILAMSNSNNCNVGFLGHTDTVSHSGDWDTDPFKLTERDGKLYGLGTSDMKGSVAAILGAVSKIDFKKLQSGLKLFFTFDEEIGFGGVLELVSNNTAFPDLMIIGEPTDNQVINASKGLLELKIEFHGVSSHASTPEEGINAIENCVDFITNLQEYYKKLKTQSINSKTATMNIGVINGGRSSNIVPEYCEVIIDFRTVLENQNQDIISEVMRLAGKKAKITIINNVTPFKGKSENINMSDFITEASFIKAKEKIILGVGPVNAHKKNEFITIKSLEKLEQQYVDLIQKNCQ
jgi:acetylornithine deacetylase